MRICSRVSYVLLSVGLLIAAGCKCELGEWTSKTAQCVGGVFSFFGGGLGSSTAENNSDYANAGFHEPLEYQQHREELNNYEYDRSRN